MKQMTNEEATKIMNDLSSKLDWIQRELNDVMRQCAVLYWGLSQAEPVADPFAAPQPTAETPETTKAVKVEKAVKIPVKDVQDDDSKKPERNPVDKGKVLALHKAGWTLKAIADDVGCSIPTVSKILKALEPAKEPEEEKNDA